MTIDEAFTGPFTKRRTMGEQLLVVGGGTMGTGIALVAAGAGYTVDIIEPQAASRQRGAEYVLREAQRRDERSLSGQIRWLEAMPVRSEAAIAIEAVPEQFALKRDVFVALDAVLSAEALLATNTSSLAVADLSDVVSNPRRVLGLHFFNPPARMDLVEVIRAAQTDDEALERAFAFVARIGKTPVLAADTPGFIVNRIARPYYLQALRALERGVASAEELDALARGVGFRMGPFELMDLIGLDVNLATSESIYIRTESPRFAPVELQRRMVAQGLLGRKSGAGFYRYVDGKAERFEPTLPIPEEERNAQERVVVVGFGDLADEFARATAERYSQVSRVENDELLPEISPDGTIVVDVGDGATDRGEIIAQLDAMFGPETLLLVDAYATDLALSARGLRHPERLIGYGLLGALSSQRAVEIVDSSAASDDALELAQEFFAAIGKSVVLVEDTAGLFLGRTVGSIVNEAMMAVHEQIASPEDVDIALRLGANYPDGPIAWGRQIGGARIIRILKRLAEAEGEAFAPHRSLWVLDVDQSAAPVGVPQ